MSNHEIVLDIIFGRWKSQILYAGVKSGIFDAIDTVPKYASEIARELGLDLSLSYRLLRALASIGFLNEKHGPELFHHASRRISSQRPPTNIKGNNLVGGKVQSTTPSGSI